MTGQHQLSRHHPAGADRRRRRGRAVRHQRGPGRRPVRHHRGDRPGRAESDLGGADGLRRAARAVKAEVLADLPGLLEQFADQVLARGGHVCWAPTAEDARRYVVDVVGRHGPPGWPSPSRWPPRRSTSTTRSRPPAPRWWRPISASGSSSWRARRRATSSPRRCTRTATRSRTCSSTRWPTPPTLDTEPTDAGGLRPRAAPGGVPGRRGRHHRRQLRRRRDRLDRAGHQRGQRPAGDRAAPGPRRRARHGARWPPTGPRPTCCSTCWPARRPASGCRRTPTSSPEPGARARSTAPTSSTSSSSTTAAATCWPASSTRCSAASAAAPASTSARCSARPAATPTAGCTPGRWGRC